MKKNPDKKVTTKKPPLDEKARDQELTEKDLDRVTGGVVDPLAWRKDRVQ